MNLRAASLLRSLFLVVIGSVSLTLIASEKPAIIPLPQSVKWREGSFQLTTRTCAILVNDRSDASGKYLAAELVKAGVGAIPVIREGGASKKQSLIMLTTQDAPTSLTAEGYSLSVVPDEIVIRGKDEAGVFYGVQTLLQMFPARAKTNETSAVRIPCVQVIDSPRFKWRGMMLDVARHFFTKEEVKQMLDSMSRYKLNTLHWHLVDDQGWRIEIKKYPKLVEMGAWRKGVGFGLDPKSTTAYGPDGRYGGFYKQADIKEVVDYATARHITVVPEIEMPGHSSAALTAYPELSCTGGPFSPDLPGGVFDGIYCAGNDQSFEFVQNVLAEVFQLFPGKYVHVGGDEVPTTNWLHCAKCQARMREQGLKHEIELENYFIRRVEKFINANHRDLIGWSEIRDSKLATNSAVMDWVGGAVEAASEGHDVVMSPLNECYFDRYQSQNQASEPHTIGGYLPLSQVYAFEPIPTNLPAQYQTHILGAQANVWTEYMPSFKHVQYMVFPRLCALSEVLWSPKEARNWESFSPRMKEHYTRLQDLGINYRRTEPRGQAASAR